MAKWADYLISAVRYSESYSGKYISHLRVHTDSGTAISDGSTYTKSDVISKINAGSSVITIYKNASGSWNKGEDVRVITVNYQDFLRTDANSIAADNLGNLPEF